MAFVEVHKQGHISVVTMHRPEALNALSSAVFQDLKRAITVVEQDDDSFVMILTGAGRAFVAGGDIAEMHAMERVQDGYDYSALAWEIGLRLERFTKPTIAAINGYALGGGCELALACDIRIASEKAKFALPETSLGITPGFGGTQRMPRICGSAAALEWILSAKTFDATHALQMGLVSQVLPPEQLMDAAMDLATSIAQQAQLAVRAAKQAIRYGLQCDMGTAVTYEALAFATCFGTVDQKNAMQAFVEKRKPDAFQNC